jgi:DNA-binding MarR family transcriptional regulator
MSSDESQRAALLALLGRKLGGEQAVKTVLFQQAIADRLGLNTTDLMCLYFLSDAESLTAGQLAEATGLTTGAVTGVIDRLEKAGYAQREKDAADRRRVLVRPQREQIDRDISPLYGAIGEAWERAIERYSTQELGVILDMLMRSTVLLQEQITTLRLGRGESGLPAEKAPVATPALPEPLAQSAQLTFANGALNVRLRGAALSELYRTRFEPPEPQVRAQGGSVQIQYPRFSLFKWRRGASEITLNRAATWQIELRDGAVDCSFDLRELTLTAFALFGGAIRLELNLGQPRGVVPIRIADGAADVTIRRPAGTAAQVAVKIGATRLRLDERYAEVSIEEACWQTPNYAAAADRFDISVEGGASSLSVVVTDE